MVILFATLVSIFSVEKISLGSFASNKLIYTSLKSSQSNKALCLVLLDRSILNLLHKASKEFELPGNFPLATSRLSIMLFFLISFFLISFN